ncbi:GUN4 domain-containing protein [Streptomyces antibioticus]|uniref:GUN4 domain-containing protein n=1 Tax=Streptomyces antibioticus TaxID=1890 RepID=UPI0033BB2657
MTATSRDVVLAVGVNRLPRLPQMARLWYAEADAVALARTFHGLGVPEDRIQTLTGPQATFDGIGLHLAGIRRRYPDLGPQDRVWFCFSGHGITGADGRTHLLVHDTGGDLRKVPHRSVTVEQVVNVLPDASAADRILLLDACRNEVSPQGKSGVRGPVAGLNAFRLGRFPGLAVFSGCGESGVSFEHPHRELGVFTAALTDILGGDERPLNVEELEDRLLTVVPRESRTLKPPCYQQPSLRTEPYWQAPSILLFPHLLTDADIRTLRRRARSLPPAGAAALWRRLSQLDPDDAEAAASHAHFSPLATTGAARGGSGLALDGLEDLLGSRRWQDADRETARLLMLAVGRDPDRVGNHMITTGDVSELRHADLAAVNELWMRYSDGRFGFTPQLQRLHAAQGDIARFADLVGWRNGRWILYPEAQWRSGAPAGHLPIIGPIGGIKPDWPLSYGRQAMTALTGLGRAAYRTARYHRHPSAVDRATAEVTVDESFDWRQYNRLAVIGLEHGWSSAVHGRLKPLTAVYDEAPLRRFATNYTSLLSVAWAVNRVRLLRHYEAVCEGEARGTDRSAGH